MKKILVSGATGNIGRELVPALLQKGAEVIAMTQDPLKLSAQENLVPVKGDFEEPKTYKEYLNGVDAAFMLTPGVPNMDQMQYDFIEACKEAGVPFLLKQSAKGSGELHDVKMFDLHKAIEVKLKDSELNYAIIRPNAFSQNILVHGNSVYQQGTIYAPAGDGGTSYIDARDVALAAAEVLLNPEEHQSATYTLTGAKSHSMGKIAGLLAAIINKEVNFIGVTPEQGKEALLGFGLSEWLAADLTAIAVHMAQGKQSEVTNDFKSITGKEPITVEEMLKESASVFTNPPQDQW